jgi:hypothetical protein
MVLICSGVSMRFEQHIKARTAFTARGREKARFDQQPVEAGGSVSASLEAYRATGEDRWLKETWSAIPQWR